MNQNGMYTPLADTATRPEPPLYVQPERLAKLFEEAIGAEQDQREAQQTLRKSEAMSTEYHAKAVAVWDELAGALLSLEALGDGGETMSALRKSKLWDMLQAMKQPRADTGAAYR